MNKIEDYKKEKDGLDVLNDLPRYAAEGWQAITEGDKERLKWTGVFFRRQTPGHFMMRVRMPIEPGFSGVSFTYSFESVNPAFARYPAKSISSVPATYFLQNAVKSPPASALLKKAAGIASGSKTPNKEKVGKVTKKQVLDIVKMKQKDLNARNEEAAFRIIAGTARSMGIEVLD